MFLGPTGYLYGTTTNTGIAGAVFKVNTASHESKLYDLPGAPGGSNPFAGVIMDSAGNLYGTAAGGTAGAGVVYKFDSAGRETVLYTFTGGGDGRVPNALVRDSAGNLYGTTKWGGASDEGVVYKLDPSGKQTVLYDFTGGADGGIPNDVTMGPDGSLYGTTFGGGAGGQTGAQEGVVFRLDLSGQETVLHSFTGLSDGGSPEAPVIFDGAGNLYGTTAEGGLGGGVVYKGDTAGNYAVLYAFTGACGGDAYGGLLFDAVGNLFGTTAGYGAGGAGVVYKLDKSGQCAALYSFSGGADGGSPFAGVVRDAAGNLYGTAAYGGDAGCNAPEGCGVVYDLAAAGVYTVLQTFIGTNGGSPHAGVILGPGKSLFGTTPSGGTAGAGFLYKLSLRR